MTNEQFYRATELSSVISNLRKQIDLFGENPTQKEILITVQVGSTLAYRCDRIAGNVVAEDFIAALIDALEYRLECLEEEFANL